ncbi:MAG: response regulator [bacterium]|nr:response regulator [bacterium]
MYRVLIADDEEYVRDLLVKNIRESNARVEIVAVTGDGRTALEQARNLRPDIVVTDISMPFLNGLELIGEMQKEGISSKNIIISGYDEFDYAKRAISLGVTDYLLKPFLPRELTDVLNKIVEELDGQKILRQNMCLLKQQVQTHAELAREHLLKQILTEKELPEDIVEKAQKMGIQIQADRYLAGILRMQDNEWDFSDQEKVEGFLMLIGEGYFVSGIRLYAVSFDRTQLSVIWCGDIADTRKFLQFVQMGLERVAASMKKYYHIQVCCGLGNVYEDIAGVRDSYQEAVSVWRRILDMHKEKPILFYEDMKKTEEKEKEKEDKKVSEQVREWKNKIRLAVKAGHQEEALSMLDGLMKCYTSLANLKPDYISVSIGELMYALANDMEAQGYHRESPDEIFQFEEKMKYGSLWDLKEILESYIKKCCKNIAENSDRTRAAFMVNQVKMLIEENLKNPDMDLEWAAAQVHFSVSYVRQAFKQNMGEGFGEYLIRKRMERAGMMLQKTSMRIQDIARECGYDNQRYFASSFKKFYGCTPTEFKAVVEREKLY